MVYNSYNFDYELKTYDLSNIISSLTRKLKNLTIPLLKPNVLVAGA